MYCDCDKLDDVNKKSNSKCNREHFPIEYLDNKSGWYELMLNKIWNNLNFSKQYNNTFYEYLFTFYLLYIHNQLKKDKNTKKITISQFHGIF